MATTETKIETTTNHVRNANADEEKILDEKVASLFSDEAVKLAALRYGRKMLRFKSGARSSTPPLGTLTQAQGAAVAKALGIEPKEKKVAKSKTSKPATKATAKPGDDVEVTPDAKPTKAAPRRKGRAKTAA